MLSFKHTKRNKYDTIQKRDKKHLQLNDNTQNITPYELYKLTKIVLPETYLVTLKKHRKLIREAKTDQLRERWTTHSTKAQNLKINPPQKNFRPTKR